MSKSSPKSESKPTSASFKFKGDPQINATKPLVPGSCDNIVKKPITPIKVSQKNARMLKETKRVFLRAKYEPLAEENETVLLEPRVEVLEPGNIFLSTRSWFNDFDTLLSKYHQNRTPQFVANDRSSIEYQTSIFLDHRQIRLTHNTVECGTIMAEWFQNEVVGILLLIHPIGSFCTFKLTLHDRHLHLVSNEDFLRSYDIFLGCSDSIEDALNRNVIDGPEVVLHLFQTNFFKPETIKSMPFHMNYDSQLFDCSRVFVKHQ